MIEDEKIQQNCEHVGEYYIAKMKKLMDKYEFIGDVRGKVKITSFFLNLKINLQGLMIGFEMSEDRQSKKPLRGELVSQIWEGAKEQGVVFGRGGLWGQV